MADRYLHVRDFMNTTDEDNGLIVTRAVALAAKGLAVEGMDVDLAVAKALKWTLGVEKGADNYAAVAREIAGFLVRND